jgi:hypothetical protein
MNLRAVTRLTVCAVAFLAGCSDPPPQPASMGLTVTFGNPANNVQTSGRFCPNPSITYSVGDPAPLLSTPGKRFEDGTHDASVKCTIKGKGDGPYTLDVRSDAHSTAMNTTTGKQVSLEFTGTATKGSTTNPITSLAAFTPDTLSLFTGSLAGVDPVSQSCNISKIYQVGAGLIHADFSCPALIGSDSTVACAASGTFVFEFCQVE